MTNSSLVFKHEWLFKAIILKSFSFISFLKKPVCCSAVLEEARRGPRWAGAGAGGSGCEPPDAGAETWARVLCKRIDLQSSHQPHVDNSFPSQTQSLIYRLHCWANSPALEHLTMISYFLPFFLGGGLRVGWVLSCIVGILHYNQSLLLSSRLYHSPVICVCFGRDWTYSVVNSVPSFLSRHSKDTDSSGY